MLKFIVTFISIGGANVALFAVKDVPRWLRAAILMLSAVAFIYALEDLPKAVDAIEVTVQRVAAWAPHEDRVPSSSPDNSILPTPLPTADVLAPEASPTPGPPLPILPRIADAGLTPSPSASVGAADAIAPDDDGIEIDSHLIIREGGSYRLGKGRTYYLDAPMGNTVHYAIVDGSISFLMDGRLQAQCAEPEYRTFAVKSRFSAIACSETALLKVLSVHRGKEIP